LAKRFQRRRILKISQSEKIWLPLAILVSDWSISKAPMEGSVLSFLKAE
jgi:hypothetical protein